MEATNLSNVVKPNVLIELTESGELVEIGYCQADGGDQV